MSEEKDIIKDKIDDIQKNDASVNQDNKLDARNYDELNKAITLAQHDVYKRYLPELSDYPIVKPSEAICSETAKNCIQMLQLKELTYTKGEDLLQKLSTIYHATMELGCSLIVMVDVEKNNDPAKIYLGVKNNGKDDKAQIALNNSFNILKQSIPAQFPGSVVCSTVDEESLVDDVFGKHIKYISSVSCVASLRDKQKTEEKKFIQGIEKLIDTMKGYVFTAVFIAEPISYAEHFQIRQGYQELYTTLSPFAKTNWSFSEENGKSIMESITTGTSKTISEGISKTKGVSANFGINIGGNKGTSIGYSETTPNYVAQSTTILSTVTGLVGGVVSMIPGWGTIGSAISVAGRSIGGFANGLYGGTISDSISKSFGTYGGVNAGFGKQQSTTATENTAETESNHETKGATQNSSLGRTIQTENTNKSVEQLLEQIDKQLKRTTECEDFGAYKCCAYFLSAKQENSLLAANTYRALMIGEGSSVEYGAINTWSNQENDNKVPTIIEYLKRFNHPVFALAINDVSNKNSEEINEDDFTYYTPATIVSGLELPLHFGLPTKSVYGLPVIERAEFGRNVSVQNQNSKDNNKFHLGMVYHMGRKEGSIVDLNCDELTAHTFITGSTGSGKTNTVCKILEKINDNGVNFLVVEPAKGEYKDKFGNRDDVFVYGTNPKLTPMLRINPFSFPIENVHVLEHLDRLVEIFNVCWPMYAAMPAILKESIERAYEEAGWDLAESKNQYGIRLFPSFSDVCRHIEQVVAESAYSADNKSDYVGALVTRVRSLTNGLNGVIFSNDEISNEDLFEKNVVVDISRVGSSETKSLIMGMLVLKLQEYRMDHGISNNGSLKHITVLEEAHNLLKRTSTEQVSESSNLLGKSVEMIANSIAEMRAYGEGFVIADQSPGLLDMSVIRNTNTKIIMRLPDLSDRELVGKAVGLNDDQIVELGKLETGVAAVMQSGWLETVLCMVEKFELKYSCSFRQPINKSKLGDTSDLFLNFILNCCEKQVENQIELKNIFNHLQKINISMAVKIDFIRYFEESSKTNLNRLIYDFFNASLAISKAETCSEISEWLSCVKENLSPSIKELNENQKKCLIEMILNEQIERDSTYHKILSAYEECFIG